MTGYNGSLIGRVVVGFSGEDPQQAPKISLVALLIAIFAVVGLLVKACLVEERRIRLAAVMVAVLVLAIATASYIVVAVVI